MNFRIEGEFLTQFARDRVIEGRFDHGYRTLHEGLMGITMDQVMSILNGTNKLIGVNEVDMVPDGDPEWPARLERHFAGTWVTGGGRYLRPYAVVTTWGPDDMGHGDKLTPDSDSVHKTSNTFSRYAGELAGCSLFYADDPQRDVLKLLQLDRTLYPGTGRTRDNSMHILFKEVRNHPFQLVAAHHTAQEALDAWLKHHTLREVGYVQAFPREHYPDRYEVTEPTAERPDLPTPLNGDSEAAFRQFGAARARAIDATNRGMTIEQYEEYQDKFRNVQIPEPVTEADTDKWTKIIIANTTDWIEFEGLRIPRAPFENWCLWRGDGAHLAMPWTPVSKSGVKMFGDDPYHTDFMLGGGLDLSMAHDPRLFDLRAKIQEEKLGFKVAVLCGTGKSAALKVVHPKRNEACQPDEVAVIPNAGPHYLAAANSAGAIICQQGGAMAHLVTVSREKNLKIVRVKDALKLYPVGMQLVVDCDKGDVHVPCNRIDYRMKIGSQIIDVDALP